jgi:DNA-binding FadR family transcriptional regulator
MSDVPTLPAVGLTTAAARTVLGPNVVGGGGLAGLVAQRLSEAIQLGILLDGERLPPESKLAEQLGVATVTLREALAVLRVQGLVTTRRGRGGGTFVSAPDLDSGLGRRLRELSIAWLRDLGDHRGAVAARTARLAAQRALPSEVSELERQLDRLRAARTASDRRRAALQFSVGVAAAAQSPRLLREEQRLAAEVGDLLWLGASDHDHAASVEAQARLAAAIGRRDPDAAVAIADQQVAAETARLIGLRLRAYLADLQNVPPPGLEAVAGALDQLFDMLERLAAELARVTATQSIATHGTATHSTATHGTATHNGAPRRDDLATLRPAIFEALAAHRDLAAGAGVITAPGLLADAPLWLEWWWTTPAGTPDQLRVNLDPAAPDFYDYTAADWYSLAERGGPVATGPYVDYFCTGEYTITLSVPVLLDGRFLGVAAADVLAGSLERLVMPHLLALGSPVALCSQDGRLIAATSADVPPDMRVPEGSAALPSPLLRWRLARFPGTPPR